jgi:ABC-type nitrate/sulfonate/bicarbonate transport system substrate-binding protein
VVNPSLLRPLAFLVLLGQLLTGCRDRPAATPAVASSEAAARRAATPLRFADVINVDVRDVPLMMAFDELAAHGHVIEKTYFGSSALITQSLERGDADIAVMNYQTAWTAMTKGVDIRTISQFTSATGLLATKATISSCRDLSGRSVGLPTTTGLIPLLFRLYVERRCPGATPQVLVLPQSSARTAALSSGAIDAAVLASEEFVRIQRQSPGAFHILMTQAGEFPGIALDGLHVRRVWAGQHREVVLDLLRAQLRAHRLVSDSPPVLYEEAMRRLSLDYDTAKAIADAYLRLDVWDLNAGLTPESVQATLDFLASEQAVPAGITAAQVADFSYLDAVLRELGRREPPAPRSSNYP